MDNIPEGNEKFKSPYFSYFDLQLDSVFTSEGEKFLTFFVDNDNPCFVNMRFLEFQEYQRIFIERFEVQQDDESCTCDVTYPSYEFIDVEKMTVHFKNEDTEEEQTEEFETPIFFVHKLIPNLNCGFHTNEKDSIFSTINLN